MFHDNQCDYHEEKGRYYISIELEPALLLAVKSVGVAEAAVLISAPEPPASASTMWKTFPGNASATDSSDTRITVGWRHSVPMSIIIDAERRAERQCAVVATVVVALLVDITDVRRRSRSVDSFATCWRSGPACAVAAVTTSLTTVWVVSPTFPCTLNLSLDLREVRVEALFETDARVSDGLSVSEHLNGARLSLTVPRMGFLFDLTTGFVTTLDWLNCCVEVISVKQFSMQIAQC